MCKLCKLGDHIADILNSSTTPEDGLHILCASVANIIRGSSFVFEPGETIADILSVVNEQVRQGIGLPSERVH